MDEDIQKKEVAATPEKQVPRRSIRALRKFVFPKEEAPVKVETPKVAPPIEEPKPAIIDQALAPEDLRLKAVVTINGRILPVMSQEFVKVLPYSAGLEARGRLIEAINSFMDDLKSDIIVTVNNVLAEAPGTKPERKKKAATIPVEIISKDIPHITVEDATLGALHTPSAIDGNN